MEAPETYGRWPLVGATALGPTAALAARDRRWLPLAALLAHQTEEWVGPGGFLPWINREVLGSEDDEFPIDRRTGFVINVCLGWGLSTAAAATGGRTAGAAAALYVSHLGNVGLHVSWAIVNRRYDPGLATALLCLLPVAAGGLRRLSRDPDVPRSQLATGSAIGGLIALGTKPLMSRRLRRAAGTG